jgi:DNA-binding CsgD family transcriptional regulator
MATQAVDAIDAHLVAGMLESAIQSIAERRSENLRDDAQIRRLATTVFAIAGREREMGAVADPRLLNCKSQAEIHVYLSDSGGGTKPEDSIAAGVVLTWCGDAPGAYRSFAEAHERAEAEGRHHIAVAAKERLAHYALLFGDVATGRTAIEEGAALAAERGLTQWRLRCAAMAARFALECDDLQAAGAYMSEAPDAATLPDAAALFAPSGVRLALLAEDQAALRRWTSQAIVDTALHGRSIDAGLAAAQACLHAAAAEEPPLGALPSLALRRALAIGEISGNAVELYTLAARCGDAEDARLAVDSLRAVFAPRRRYIEAHYLLARAYGLLRAADRAGATSSAGDAARAFDALGLRQWTNEAMLLLVHNDGAAFPQSRRRPTALSLTRREEQVAHLISRGASNREVARTLQISEHTVERHVSSILSRLGLRSRWQIVDRRIANGED